MNEEIFYNSYRHLDAQVELLDSSFKTTEAIFSNDCLQSFEISQTGDDSKFFGFPISQKANVKAINASILERGYKANDLIKISLIELESDTEASFPVMKVTEVHIDEKTKVHSITAYDCIYSLNNYTFADLELTAPYTIADVLDAIAAKTNIEVDYSFNNDGRFGTSYTDGINIDESKSVTLLQIMNYIAEATQTVYKATSGVWGFRVFQPDLSLVEETITSGYYYSLSTRDNRRLTRIEAVTELGDNVSAELEQSGTTQYINENPFWSGRVNEDIGDLVQAALNRIGGYTVAQFDMEWCGNPSINDTIAQTIFPPTGLEPISVFFTNVTYKYNGGYTETAFWHYSETDNASTASNPATIGDAIKKTYAKVDKVNQTIELNVSSIADNSARIASLEMDSNSISAAMSSVQELSEQVSEIENSVSAQLTSEDIQILINETIAGGNIDSVTTSTGYTFNEEGLTVSKSDSSLSTTISEDGMKIQNTDNTLLTVDSTGVDAQNLHATTYLIIGNNSRFEDYTEDNEERTGCFWIGG